MPTVIVFALFALQIETDGMAVTALRAPRLLALVLIIALGARLIVSLISGRVTLQRKFSLTLDAASQFALAGVVFASLALEAFVFGIQPPIFAVFCTPPMWIVTGGLALLLGGTSGCAAPQRDGGGAPVPAPPETRDLQLDIYDGQGAKTPAAKARGGITVANLNDTDVNSAQDINQSPVASEIDLMRLVLGKPNSDQGGEVTLSITAGADKVKIWTSATKAEEVALPKRYATSELPKTLWVEGRKRSAAVRDVVFRLTYLSTSDEARATLVWVEKDDFKNKPTDAIWPQASAGLKKNFAELNNSMFGKLFDAKLGVRYSMGMRFRVFPSGVGKEHGVRFNTARQMDFITFYINPNGPLGRISQTNALGGDDATDGWGTTDEDAEAKQDEIYCIDGPGTKRIDARGRLAFIKRANFFEFVRVRFDGVKPSGRVDGSRCSNKIPWHIQMGLKPDAAGKWVEDPARPNEVEEGHIVLGDKP
jgi:hypothetical protein